MEAYFGQHPTEVHNEEEFHRSLPLCSSLLGTSATTESGKPMARYVTFGFHLIRVEIYIEFFSTQAKNISGLVSWHAA